MRLDKTEDGNETEPKIQDSKKSPRKQETSCFRGDRFFIGLYWTLPGRRGAMPHTGSAPVSVCIGSVSAAFGYTAPQPSRQTGEALAAFLRTAADALIAYRPCAAR